MPFDGFPEDYEREPEKLPFLNGISAVIVAHELVRAAECRKASIGWVWHGKWTAQDWKDSARDHVTLARQLRLAGAAP